MFDMALQHYGTLDGGLALLLADNPTALSVEGFARVGGEWRVRNTPILPKIATAMQAIVPVSGEPPLSGVVVVDATNATLTDDAGNLLSND